MNAKRRVHGARALAVLATMIGTCLLAGCTSNGSTVTTPVGTGPASTAPSGGARASGTPASSAPASSAPASSAPASGTPTGNAPAGPGASAEAAGLAALKAGPTVHIDIESTDATGTVTTFSDDATATGGQQIITIGGDEHATIIFIGNIGYLRANESALVNFVGVTAAQAPALAGKWLSFSSGDTLGTTTYSSLVAGITLSSVASEIQLSGPDTVTGPESLNGQSVLAIASPAAANQQLPPSARMTLYVSAKGSRPVVEKLSGAGQEENQVSFSHWGETVHLTAPRNALPVSSLGQPPVLA